MPITRELKWITICPLGAGLGRQPKTGRDGPIRLRLGLRLRRPRLQWRRTLDDIVSRSQLGAKHDTLPARSRRQIVSPAANTMAGSGGGQ